MQVHTKIDATGWLVVLARVPKAELGIFGFGFQYFCTVLLLLLLFF
jgi:uncharacterized membrane protein